MYKNTIIYEINEKSLIGEDGEKYISFGVDCFEAENGFKKLVNQVVDISVDLHRVKEFVDKLNEVKLSPECLYDAVEDFVCEIDWY